MRNPLAWSLLDGVFPTCITIFGGVASVYLLYRRDQRWFMRILPIVSICSIIAVFIVRWLVDDVWHPFPDALPLTVLTWTGATIAGIGLFVARFKSSRWPARALSALAAFVVFLMALNHANTFFGYYPNLRDVLGLSPPDQIALSSADSNKSMPITLRPGVPLAQLWNPPADMPKSGKVVEAVIPGLESGFVGRPAWLYLPPAYFAAHRPLLPVLELLEGQPGNPRNWLDGGQLASMMDTFARRHKGLAPVVVMPDDLGSYFANPLCMNSRLGNLDTYLARDVPNWVRGHLIVNMNMADWSVAGPSYGGTCALQLAVLHPKLFPTFVDIAGQYQQTLGTAQETVDAAFGGDYQKFALRNPVQILATHTRRETWTTIAVGTGDAGYLQESRLIAALCRKAGMHVRWLAIPGGHSWDKWSTLLAKSLDWLGQRAGLI